MFSTFPDRVINTHPALLPAFKGWHAVEDALAAGATTTGCTVHLATAEVDEGPILAQEALDIRADDTVESLHERIKEIERRIYPMVLRRLVDESTATP
jgi:phosphoribosylglycinamide formyltransferase-1